MNPLMTLITDINNLITMQPDNPSYVEYAVRAHTQLSKYADKSSEVAEVLQRLGEWILDNVNMLCSQEFLMALEDVKPLLLPYWQFKEDEPFVIDDESIDEGSDEHSIFVIFCAAHIEKDNARMFFYYYDGNMYFSDKYVKTIAELRSLEPVNSFVAVVVKYLSEEHEPTPLPVDIISDLDEYDHNLVHDHALNDDRNKLRVTLSDLVTQPHHAQKMFDHIHSTLGLHEPYETSMSRNRYYADFTHTSPITKVSLRDKLNLYK